MKTDAKKRDDKVNRAAVENPYKKEERELRSAGGHLNSYLFYWGRNKD